MFQQSHYYLQHPWFRLVNIVISAFKGFEFGNWMNFFYFILEFLKLSYSHPVPNLQDKLSPSLYHSRLDYRVCVEIPAEVSFWICEKFLNIKQPNDPLVNFQTICVLVFNTLLCSSYFPRSSWVYLTYNLCV
jgi:hypothetical protein